MRFIATAVATISVVLVISSAAPELSGQSAAAPCEVTSQVPAAKLSAPNNLRIVSESKTAAVRGTNAATAATSGDLHAYFSALASRPDCVRAYSLRNVAQVAQYRKGGSPRVMNYLYPTDPDPRRQDAMKIELPEGARSVRSDQQVRLPLGHSAGRNLLVVWENWWGAEFHPDRSDLTVQKLTPLQFTSPGDGVWFGFKMHYANARVAVHNQPPGGPYVAFPYPHVEGGDLGVKPPFYVDGNPAFPRLQLPSDAPPRERRGYAEGIAPVAGEFGVVAERWTRYWWFFERAPQHDWQTTLGTMQAYKLTVWGADTEREPVQILNEAIVAPHPGSNSFDGLRLWGSAATSNGQTPVGRGPMVAYTRNYAVLQGTPKADVLRLLQKPVK